MQIGWEDTADNLEIQRPCGAQARLPAAVSKGAVVLFAKPGELRTFVLGPHGKEAICAHLWGNTGHWGCCESGGLFPLTLPPDDLLIKVAEVLVLGSCVRNEKRTSP